MSGWELDGPQGLERRVGVGRGNKSPVETFLRPDAWPGLLGLRVPSGTRLGLEWAGPGTVCFSICPLPLL